MEVEVEEEIALEGAVLEEGEALAVFGTGVVTEGFAHGGHELQPSLEHPINHQRMQRNPIQRSQPQQRTIHCQILRTHHGMKLIRQLWRNGRKCLGRLEVPSLGEMRQCLSSTEFVWKEGIVNVSHDGVFGAGDGVSDAGPFSQIHTQFDQQQTNLGMLSSIGTILPAPSHPPPSLPQLPPLPMKLRQRQQRRPNALLHQMTLRRRQSRLHRLQPCMRTQFRLTDEITIIIEIVLDNMLRMRVMMATAGGGNGIGS
mmetsp:Transcript_7971/g.14344  ORF Transcript_7971/g.14344 Transcript_7971/m.14344 type:complete len:256 (-) Transcript_7971:401-1168(-)